MRAGHERSKFLQGEGAVKQLRSRADILVVASFLPAQGTHGGAAQMYNFWRNIAQFYKLGRLHLACTSAPGENRRELVSRLDFFDTVTVENHSEGPSLGVDGIPQRFNRFESKRLAQAISKICDSKTLSLVSFEMAMSLMYLPYTRNGVPKLAFLHEALPQRFMAAAKKDYIRRRSEYRAGMDMAMQVRAFECSALAKCDYVNCFSESDKSFYSKLLERSDIGVVPLVVDPKRIRQSARGVEAEPLVVSFSGAFTHSPNVDAMDFFLSRVWPLVRERCPGARFRIFGNGVSEALRERWGTADAVTIVGHVKNLYAAVASSRVVVVPVVSGSGVRTKLLEALAIGRPVVATRLGADGVDVGHGRGAWISSNPSGLAEGICRLLREDELWQKIVADGKAAVTRHDAQRVATAFLASVGLAREPAVD